jgi:hypothetical protein
MRGQELPISTIVLIVVAIIILVLAIFFIVLPIAGVSFGSSPSTNMTSFTFNCQTYCGQPSNNNNVPANTEFCTSTINYGGQTYHCYNSSNGKVIATCAYTADNGTYFSNVDSFCCRRTGSC